MNGPYIRIVGIENVHRALLIVQIKCPLVQIHRKIPGL